MTEPLAQPRHLHLVAKQAANTATAQVKQEAEKSCREGRSGMFQSTGLAVGREGKRNKRLPRKSMFSDQHFLEKCQAIFLDLLCLN